MGNNQRHFADNARQFGAMMPFINRIKHLHEQGEKQTVTYIAQTSVPEERDMLANKLRDLGLPVSERRGKIFIDDIVIRFQSRSG